MNHRERALAVLNYQPYDRLPIVHFGFWQETLEQWADEGHISHRLAATWGDGNRADREISRQLSFDFNWSSTFGANLGLYPAIRRRVLEKFPDGSQKVLDNNGAIILVKPGIVSIPTELDHLLKGRAEWEKLYRPRLQWSEGRLRRTKMPGKILEPEQREAPLGLACGSLIGGIRNYVGLVGLSYLTADDPALLDEMIETVAGLCHQGSQATLEAGARPDFGHFWEDICYRAGPLVNPRFFRAKMGPGYRRITDLLHAHGIYLVSVDCDGKIDALIPTWLENGVNVMFPIEVGVWGASIAPWREQYGRELRGVGGMDKRAFAQDYAAVDAEIERLKPLVDLGGYLPCPDHRIAPDAKWENVQYYCERMRQVFG
ncbi:MAG: hypothetical protein CVU38_08800 [Chloroflexi bacterium HGW-Chloroflexi-1]|nr:MAG: hypothetical protein CVU38_08800 [Chloroflexi bacterium HGW-Chloroflexi-1]